MLVRCWSLGVLTMPWQLIRVVVRCAVWRAVLQVAATEGLHARLHKRVTARLHHLFGQYLQGNAVWQPMTSKIQRCLTLALNRKMWGLEQHPRCRFHCPNRLFASSLWLCFKRSPDLSESCDIEQGISRIVEHSQAYLNPHSRDILAVPIFTLFWKLSKHYS